jgi:3-hydroxyisobutyrate dehydrogenase
MDKVIEVVSQGAAANWFLSHRGRSMVEGKFQPGFKLALHRKDLVICRALAGSGRLPVVELTLADYERLIGEGLGDEDISVLYRHKRRLLGLAGDR